MMQQIKEWLTKTNFVIKWLSYADCNLWFSETENKFLIQNIMEKIQIHICNFHEDKDEDNEDEDEDVKMPRHSSLWKICQQSNVVNWNRAHS